MRRLILAVLIAAPALFVPGMATAAVGDPLPGNPAPTLPAQPDSIYGLFVRCYDLAPAGNLPRRACYSYLSKTGELIQGSGQTFIYPPPAPVVPAITDGQPTFPTPVTPSNPAPAPAPAPASPSRPAPAPAPVTPIAHATPSPEVLASGPTATANGDPIATRESDAAGCTPNAVRGMPGYDPILDPDNNGVSCEPAPAADATPPAQTEPNRPAYSFGDGVIYGLGAVALLVLATMAIIRLRKRPRHAAE